MRTLQHVRTRRQLFRVTAVQAPQAFLSLRWPEIPHPQPAAPPSVGTLPIKGDKDFDSFRRSSGAGTANWR